MTGHVLARQGRALRAKLRERLPGLAEVVYMYERQQSLVISYSPTGSGQDGVCALSLHPDALRLSFGKGARLATSDPGLLLQGGGTVRHVALEVAADFDRPEIQWLVAAAVELAGLRLDAGAEGPVILRAASQKRRAARRKPGARAR